MKNLLAIFFSLFVAATLQAETFTAPSGSGTSSNPFLIVTVGNLYWLSQNSAYRGMYCIQTDAAD